MKKKLFTTGLILTSLLTTPFFAQTDSLISGNQKGGMEALKIMPLQRGEIVTLSLNEDVNSDNANIGDIVKLKVKIDVQSEGFILIKEGNYGEAIVRDVRKARNFGRGGQLILEVDNVIAFDGHRIALQSKSFKVATGDHKKKKAWTLIATGIAVASGTGIVTLGAGGVFCGLPMITIGTMVYGQEAIIKTGSTIDGLVKKTQDVGADPRSANQQYYKN